MRAYLIITKITLLKIRMMIIIIIMIPSADQFFGISLISKKKNIHARMIERLFRFLFRSVFILFCFIFSV